MECWKRELENDSDKDFVSRGVKKSFHIIQQPGEIKEAKYINHKSATEYIKDYIEKIILEETESSPIILSQMLNQPMLDQLGLSLNQTEVTDSFYIVVCLQEAP